MDSGDLTWIGPEARLFAEFYDRRHAGPLPGELEYIRRRIEDGGQPVLELGCGTGRLLVPLAAAGVEMVGVDVSPAMIERAAARVGREGLRADLVVQSFIRLDVGREFGTIVLASGGLGVLIREADLVAMLRRVREHLRPGGVFAFELETPRPAGQEAESSSEERTAAADGSALVLRAAHTHDPETGIRRSHMTIEREVDGTVVESEQHDTAMRFWALERILTLVDDAAFIDVRVTAALSDDEPAAGDRWLAVRGQRPE